MGGRVSDIGQVVVEHLPTVSVVALHGDHDIATVPAIEAALDAVLERGTNVVVDLSRTSFMDSSVVRSTILGHRALMPGRVVAVAAPPGTGPRRLLDLVELAAVVPVFDSLEDAIAGAAARPPESGAA
jgi:anti-sigma B factor antagonist